MLPPFNWLARRNSRDRGARPGPGHLSSPDLTTLGSVTNKGTIATQYGSATITIPAKSTFYNSGAIQAVHGNTLIVAGVWKISPAGYIDVAGGTFRARCEICLY